MNWLLWHLNWRLGIEGVAYIVRRGRLGWSGHLEIKSMGDYVSTCRDLKVPGPKSKDRGRKTCVDQDMLAVGLKADQFLERGNVE